MPRFTLKLTDFTSKSGYDKAKKNKLTKKLLGKPSGKRLGQWTLKDVNNTIDSMNKKVVEEEKMMVEEEEMMVEGEEEVEEYVDPKELSEKDLIGGDNDEDNHNNNNTVAFEKKDFCSAKAFQIAVDNKNIINVNDMGKKSSKKNQWTISDVKKAIEMKQHNSNAQLHQ